jgi:hypothetical protein
MLVINGHESHIGQQLLRKAYEEKIVVCKLPAHTTHRLQPLDVGVYSVLQRAWQKRCSKIVGEFGHPMRRKQVVEQYFIARKSTFKPETIHKSFVNLCLCLSEDCVPFKDNDFAPSANTSIEVHVPLGFPTDDPTKEDLELLISHGLIDNKFVLENDIALHYPANNKGDSDSDGDEAVDSDIKMIKQCYAGQDSFQNYKARTPERRDAALSSTLCVITKEVGAGQG